MPLSVPFPPVMLWALPASAAVAWLVSMRYDPDRPVGRLVRCWTLGMLALTAWDLLPLPRLGVNPLSALTAGALGLPGLGLLAVLRLL